LQEACRLSPIPIIALSGMTGMLALEARRRGASGIGVAEAWFGQPPQSIDDPEPTLGSLDNQDSHGPCVLAQTSGTQVE
jgi:hypothetical protein